MSSANLVTVAYVKELEYGVTPVGTDAANLLEWTNLRKVSENINGKPTVTESAEARSDRQSSGQISTGLEVSGGVEYEVAGSVCYRDLIEAGMLDTFEPATALADIITDLVIAWDPVTKKVTLTTAAGSFTNILAEFGSQTPNKVKGHIIQIQNNGTTTGDSVSVKNRKCVFIEIGSATVLAKSIIGFARDMESQAGGVKATLFVPRQAKIGKEIHSFTVTKNFDDLTVPNLKTLVYRGVLVNNVDLTFAYGEIAKGSLQFVANGYEAPEVPVAPNDASPWFSSILPATAEIALNASVDVGLVIVDNKPADYCIQSLATKLNNNFQAQTCIGSLTPEKYVPGTAAITADLVAYLEDSNWEYIQKKVLSTPVQVVYYGANQDGGVGINIPELQLDFDDPASAGKNQIVQLNMSGTAKYSDIEEYQNSMFLYWLEPNTKV